MLPQLHDMMIYIILTCSISYSVNHFCVTYQEIDCTHAVFSLLCYFYSCIVAGGVNLLTIELRNLNYIDYISWGEGHSILSYILT